MILPFDIKFENVKPIVLIRGAGDLATGVIQALHRAGFSLVATEVPEPSAIRRSVALCEAVYDGRTEVEDCEAQLCSSVGEALELLDGNAQMQSQTAPAINDMNGDRHVDESEHKAKPKEPAPAVSSGAFQQALKADKQEQGQERKQKQQEQEKQQDQEEQDAKGSTFSPPIPLLIDPSLNCLSELKPFAIVDAIIAKKNTDLQRRMAPITIALGPGFSAGEDCDIVVETMRGHNLGRLIFSGTARPNSGIPGLIAGHDADRVIHSPATGIIHNLAQIGDLVEAGQILADIEGVPVKATIHGVLRGLIRDGFAVSEGLKIADIDPRYTEQTNCFTISDKARAHGNATLQALLILMHKNRPYL